MKFQYRFSVLFLVSFTAMASPNHGFSAKSNKDPIFIEKCELYKQALKEGDLPLLKSFVEKRWLEGDKAPRVEQHILKKANRYQQVLSDAGNYIVQEKRLSTMTKDNVAQVLITWTNGDKFTMHDGCVFEKIESSELWEIDL